MTSDDDDVVRVSAPGKLLLFGEHAAVYGLPVVAAALSDLRIQVEIVSASVACLVDLDDTSANVFVLPCRLAFTRL